MGMGAMAGGRMGPGGLVGGQMRAGPMNGGHMHAHGMSGDTLRGPHMQGRHTHDQGMGADRMQGRHMQDRHMQDRPVQDRPVQAPMGEEARGGMGMRMRVGQEAPAAPRETPAHLQEGERVFRDVCSQCHTMDPPPNLAPPMSHVARHLREAFTDEDGAVAHVRSYLPSPEAERSILPEMARERFGLMPAQPLSPELLEAVGRYIWFLGSPQG